MYVHSYVGSYRVAIDSECYLAIDAGYETIALSSYVASYILHVY